MCTCKILLTQQCGDNAFRLTPNLLLLLELHWCALALSCLRFNYWCNSPCRVTTLKLDLLIHVASDPLWQIRVHLLVYPSPSYICRCASQNLHGTWLEYLFFCWVIQINLSKLLCPVREHLHMIPNSGPSNFDCIFVFKCLKGFFHNIAHGC
jgi:hypothetical protein